MISLHQRVKRLPLILRRSVLTLLTLAGAAIIGWFLLPLAIPIPPPLLAGPPTSPMFLDRHGRTIVRLPLENFTRAQPLAPAAIPHDLISCTLAAEDKRFLHHGGIDLLAVARSTRDLIAHRRILSGASTITQQLIKISSPPRPRNGLAKLREALAARHLEMSWGKQEILTAYLNRLDYGNLRLGANEAARFYFGKPVGDLSLAESALLAGLPQAPSRLNPLRYPQRALTRRNTVLTRLQLTGKIPAARIAAALKEPLTLQPAAHTTPASAPWLARTTSRPPAGPIHTTLDLSLQQDLEAIVREETSRLKSSNLRHAAVVVIHNPTGEILASISSANWADPRGGQINGTLTPRSPGSTLKPFTYILAFEHTGRLPSSILADIPTPFRTPQGLDLPENYDHAYRGPVTLRTALACSLNLPALRELNTLGGPRPLHTLLRSLDMLHLGQDPAPFGLGLTLGNAPVTLLELTNAYATLARGGIHFPPTLYPSPPPTGARLFTARSAWWIADILSDKTARAPSFPPGGPLDLPFRCAAKTGTSSDFRDNWCIGFTPTFTVGVWAGNFEGQPMTGISGVTGAGPVFRRAMIRAHRDSTPQWFLRPADLHPIVIDSRTGHRLAATTALPQARTDFAPADHLPPPAAPADYDKAGRACVDATFAEWFRSPYNHRLNELALTTAPTLIPLQIILPADHSEFLLDPDIPSGSGKLRPITNLPGIARWSSPTLRIQPSTPEPIIHLSPGTHTLTATDSRTGTSQSLTLHVKSL